MLNLALSVIFSTLIFIIFKLFDRYKIQTLYAIITNYLVACIVGLLLYQNPNAIFTIPKKPWFLGTLALGLLFIVVFNLMATTAQKVGVSVASVATKMSFVIPVIVGLALYNEQSGFLKITGILLAMAAVYFTSKKDSNISFNPKVLILPILVFLGSGIIDATLHYMQKNYVAPEEFSLFSSTVFGSAAAIGILFILFKATKKPLQINVKNIAGGIVLGIPNFFSIYFLLKALDSPNLNSASIFTINNVAIVLFSTVLGILLFKEKITAKNWLGIALAILSITLVAIG